MTSKKIDMLVLIIFLLLGIAYSIFTKNLFIGKAVFAAAVFVFPPIIYLGIRGKKPWKKIVFSALIFGLLFGFFFEFIEEFNESYSVISRVFPKILGVVPVDNILGHTMMTFLTLVFYEHFVNQSKNQKISNRGKIIAFISLLAIAVMTILFKYNPNLLRFNYSYLYMGSIAIIPPILLGIKKPQLIKDMSITSIYFFFLYLSTELLAVKYNWWAYGGNYVGTVTLFDLSFPFEELFFWMLFYAASLISYYKIFIDRDDHQ
jgi:hypothetical protein